MVRQREEASARSVFVGGKNANMMTTPFVPSSLKDAAINPVTLVFTACGPLNQPLESILIQFYS